MNSTTVINFLVVFDLQNNVWTDKIQPGLDQYLIYLGIRSIFGQKQSLTITSAIKNLSYERIFWQSFFTNALNPKVALFFLAFLPQFLNISKENIAWQILFLGVWFNIGGTLVNIFVSLLFGRVRQWLGASASVVKWQQRITGALLIALGIRVALGSRK